ncbi:MAG TPA: FAD-dependent oxidoreductase [Pseudomonadales bacterium]|nr:FAD-dependent oxidoreductase [Pseudomonadales bacterium]
MPHFTALFEPIQIGTMQVKNRIVMAPMTTDYGNDDQTPSERLMAYLEARAKGGVGLITMEVCTVDVAHRYLQRSLTLGDDSFIDSHKPLIERVHAHGAKIQPQITHPGPESIISFFSATQAVGPSPVVSPVWGTACRELALEEIPAIIEQYAQAARRAQAAGYDGIELHAAHSYHLIGSFLSPFRNKRKDAYAGHKFATRSRLLLEVVAAMRDIVGTDFPITVRLAGYERVPGGRELDDTQRLAPMLVEAGASAFHISGGGTDKLVSQIVASSAAGYGFNTALAESVRRVVKVPVMVVGRIQTPEQAENIIKNQQADMVVMGRQMLADPDWAMKAQNGAADNIRRCISCENCIDSMNRGTLACAINPFTGRETELLLTRAEKSRHVVIVGAGPAGLEAARVASLRGHRVTLLEREQRLGGALLLAATVHDDNRFFLDYLQKTVRDLPITIRTGTDATPALLRELNPDVVIVATGSQVVLPHKLALGEGVWFGRDVRELLTGRWQRWARHWPSALAPLMLKAGDLWNRFLKPQTLQWSSHVWMPFGKRVVLIGNDLPAIELAEFFAKRRRDVYLLSTETAFLPEVGRKRRAEHMDKLDQAKVRVLTDLTIHGMSGKRVEYSPGAASTRHVLDVDSVIIAGDAAADMSLAEQLTGAGFPVQAIGDCSGYGLIVKAVREAAELACAL